MHDASPRCILVSGTGSAPVRVTLPTVLLAEDDPAVRRIAEIVLAREGFEVSSVGDGLEAMKVLEQSRVDLVILDGLMPKLDGIEACRRLKADPRTADIPVIILSARSRPSDELASRAAGAAGYIRKPFDATTLGQQVRRLCAIR